MGKEKAEYEISLKDLFSKPIGDAERHAGRFESKIGNIQASMKGLVTAGAAIAVAMKLASAAFDFAKESLHEFTEMETAMTKLNGAISIRGGTAAAVKELKEQAEALQQIGIFSDDQIVQAQTMAAQFGFNAEQIKKIMPIVADTAAATGKSIEAVMGMVQAGTSGMGRSLKKEWGILVEDTGSKTKNLANTLDALKGKFAGMNEVIAETTQAGRIAKLTNQFNDIKEEIGGGLFKVFDKLYPVINKAMAAMTEFFKGGVVAKGVEMLKRVAEFLKPIFDAQVRYLNIIKDAFIKVYNYFAQFKSTFQQVFVVLRALAVGMFDAIGAVVSFLTDAVLVIVDVLHTLYVFLEKIGVIWVLVKVFEGLWWALKKVGSLLAWLYENTLKPIFNAIAWVYGKIKDLLGIKTQIQVTKTEKSVFEELGKKGEPGIGSIGGGDSGFKMSDKTKADSVSGQKSTIINVNIGKLVETIKLTSQTMTQGIGQIKEDVAKALIEAVNDSQIIAGG